MPGKKEENIEKQEIFSEEFNKSDVVSSKNDEQEESKSAVKTRKEKITQQDLAYILNFDEEKRKNQSFSEGITSKSATSVTGKKELEELIAEKFLDFLEAPRISGKFRGKSVKNLIPSEFITGTKGKVEITDEPEFTRDDEHKTSVVVNRGENGDVESIEFLCKCGETTVIHFDYEQEVAISDNKEVSIDEKEGPGEPEAETESVNENPESEEKSEVSEQIEESPESTGNNKYPVED